MAACFLTACSAWDGSGGSRASAYEGGGDVALYRQGEKTMEEYQNSETCVEVILEEEKDLIFEGRLPATGCDRLMIALDSGFLFYSMDGKYQSGPFYMENTEGLAAAVAEIE